MIFHLMRFNVQTVGVLYQGERNCYSVLFFISFNSEGSAPTFLDTPEKNRYSISICIAHVNIDAPIHRRKSIDVVCIDMIFYNIITIFYNIICI